MNIIKDILKRGIQGVFIGIVLVQTIGVISILLSGSTEPIATDFFIRQYVAGAILGFTFGTLNLLYQVEKLGLTLATVLHFIGQATVYFPVALYAGWIGADAMTLIGVAIQGTIIYFVIWMVCYLRWKKDIKEINSKIKR